MPKSGSKPTDGVNCSLTQLPRITVGTVTHFKENIHENEARHPEELTEVQPPLVEENETEMLIKA